jgi:hypothetical protein
LETVRTACAGRFLALTFESLDKALVAFPGLPDERLVGLLVVLFAAFFAKADIQTPSSRSTRGGMVNELGQRSPELLSRQASRFDRLWSSSEEQSNPYFVN